MRRSAGASDTSDASSMSSGRMPSTTCGRRSCGGRDAPRRPRRARADGTPPTSTTRPSVGSVELRVDEVHRGRADEAGDEQVHRMLVQRLRAVDLLQLALAQHGDAITHRHRLGLVVRDVDRRDAEVVLDARDLGAHLDAQLRVEVRERLVHQERLRMPHDRAAHRDALALPAGERFGLAAEQLRRARGCAPRRRTRSSISRFGIFCSLRPNAMLSNTVMCG